MKIFVFITLMVASTAAIAEPRNDSALACMSHGFACAEWRATRYPPTRQPSTGHAGTARSETGAATAAPLISELTA
jgi:hypothetical protein